MQINSTQHYRINKPLATMYNASCINAECTSQYLLGEIVTSHSEHPNPAKHSIQTQANESWIYVVAERDGYTGYMQSTDLQIVAPNARTPTHWISQRSTLVFSEPSIKSRVLHHLPFLARVKAGLCKDNDFLELDTNEYIWREHTLAHTQYLNTSATRLVQTHFLGAPYLWGGCSPSGVDCSGLIQAIANAKGIVLPRDSGDQEQAIANTIDRNTRQAGDLVYWPGHVGILLDKQTLLHATAHTLSCIQEPLADVEHRAGEISSVKRLFEQECNDA